MIRYVVHKDINKRQWDECISSSVNGRIYAFSWYLDIVAEYWDALILDDYQAVFPLPFRKKMGIPYVFQPMFTQQLGLYSKQPMYSGLLEDFLRKVPRQFRYVNINLNQHNQLLSPQIQSVGRLNIEMDLVSDYSCLRSHYSTNLKRNLKKASASKLTVFENLKPDAVIALFRENKGKELKVFQQSDYTRLLRLIYKALQLGKAEVWGAYTSENTLCAAAVFLRSHRRVSFLFSGSNALARQTGALPYLLDAFIEANSGVDLVFDFEGSNNPQLARFYKGFGGKSIPYQQVDWLRVPACVKPVFGLYLSMR